MMRMRAPTPGMRALRGARLGMNTQAACSIQGATLMHRESVRGFASSGEDSAAYAILKRDFRRWATKEVQLLIGMTIVGVVGVSVYQKRENAPAKKVVKLLDSAREHAKTEDRQGALKDCLQAYTIVKSTNAQDRHLFELAFAIAAQYETLGNGCQATKYYLDALGHVPYIREASEQLRSRLVVLDRIAQCYQDQGEHRAAENYYRQSIDVCDRSHGTSTPSSTTGGELEKELPGVLFNYGQFLMHQKRWEDAEQVLQRAHSAAKAAQLSTDHMLRIDRLLDAFLPDDEESTATNDEK